MFSVSDLCHKQTRCCSKMLLHDSGGGEGQVCTQSDRLVQHYTACPVRLFKGISCCCHDCPLFTSDCRYLEITLHVYSSVLFPLLRVKPTRLFSCEIFAFLPHCCMTLTLWVSDRFTPSVLCCRFLTSWRPPNCSLQLHLC